jgi:hypothetical protein
MTRGRGLKSKRSTQMLSVPFLLIYNIVVRIRKVGIIISTSPGI